MFSNIPLVWVLSWRCLSKMVYTMVTRTRRTVNDHLNFKIYWCKQPCPVSACAMWNDRDIWFIHLLNLAIFGKSPFVHAAFEDFHLLVPLPHCGLPFSSPYHNCVNRRDFIGLYFKCHFQSFPGQKISKCLLTPWLLFWDASKISDYLEYDKPIWTVDNSMIPDSF